MYPSVVRFGPEYMKHVVHPLSSHKKLSEWVGRRMDTLVPKWKFATRVQFELKAPSAAAKTTEE